MNMYIYSYFKFYECKVLFEIEAQQKAILDIKDICLRISFI